MDNTIKSQDIQDEMKHEMLESYPGFPTELFARSIDDIQAKLMELKEQYSGYDTMYFEWYDAPGMGQELVLWGMRRKTEAEKTAERELYIAAESRTKRHMEETILEYAKKYGIKATMEMAEKVEATQ